jgi:protease I
MADEQPRIAMLIEEGFDDDEVTGISDLFENAGVPVTLVAPFPGRLYAGREGRLNVSCDIPARLARARLFAAIVIPGGYAADRLRMRHVVLDLVRDAIAQNIAVAAMGHGPQVLISAAAINGRTVTCWPSIAIDVTNAGGLYVDRPVVDDRGVITSRKIDDASAFVDAILRRIRRSH